MTPGVEHYDRELRRLLSWIEEQLDASNGEGDLLREVDRRVNMIINGAPLTATELKRVRSKKRPIPAPLPTPDLPALLAAAAERAYGLPGGSVRGECRRATHAAARHLCFYILRTDYGVSVEAIGEAYGRDHSTVCNGLAAVQGRIDDVALNTIRRIKRDALADVEKGGAA